MSGTSPRNVGFVALLLLGVVAVLWLAQAGSLDPPGPPAPTTTAVDETDPRTPIRTADLPLTISQSGSYYLAENISYSGSGNGITINIGEVTLDFSGFELVGSGSGAGDGIHVSNGFGIRIVNGSIRSWGGDGIDAFDCQGCVISGLRVSLNGGDGIITGPQAIITNCVAADNGDRGIEVHFGSVVSSCTATNNGTGIHAWAGSTVRACAAYSNTDNGIRADAATVTGCTAYSNGADGISAFQDCTITNCTANRNGGDGIEVESGCHVLANNCNSNGVNTADGAGIHATSVFNRIEGNDAKSNDRGIKVDGTANVIIKNSAANNGTNYDIVGGNDVGPIGTAATSTSPWANL